MPRNRLVSLGVLAAAGALGCALYASIHRTGAPVDLAAPARAFEGKLREQAAALSARVTTLSDLPRLASAVATDATTVRDLTTEELAFRPRAGEVISISQHLRDGKRVTLLTLPDGAEPDPFTTAGTRTSLRAGTIVLAQTAEIKPTERADELTGLLTVTSPADLNDLRATLLAAAPSARVEIGGASLAFGPLFPSGPASGTRVDVHLPGGAPATLAFATAAETDGTSTGLWALAAGLGAAAGVAFVLGSRRRAAPHPARSGSDSGLPADVGAPRSGGAPPSLASAAAPGASALPASMYASTSAAGPSGAPSAYPPTAHLAEGLPASAAFAATIAPGSAPPAEQRIGRYAIVRPLGQGGMAEVFLARAEGEAGFGKLVAFKVLQPAFASNPAVVDLFLDEARLVAGLDHPNIVQTHDLGRAGDRYFIAMEYVDGSDLARLIERVGAQGERIPLPCALGILCRVCDGLHAAHTAAGPDGKPLWLVHRDVKSANVFVSRTGAVKVGDFGIAKATHAVRVSRTEVGQVKGTPGTMAPEQRLGHEVDRRADVYGVGAIAYELLSGSPVNLDLVALVARGTVGWPHLPPLSGLRADVPRELDAIIFKALAYDPTQRYEDCAALEHALRTVGATTGVAEDKVIGTWARHQLDRPAPGAALPRAEVPR